MCRLPVVLLLLGLLGAVSRVHGEDTAGAAAAVSDPEAEPEVAKVEHVYGNFSYLPEAADLGTVHEGGVKHVLVNFPFCARPYLAYRAVIEDALTAVVANVSDVHATTNPHTGCHGVVVSVRGVRLGAAILDVSVDYENEDTSDPCSPQVTKADTYRIVVMRPPMVEGKVFRLITAVFLVILNFGFGCSLNLDVVREILRKPIAPLVGFCCQYLMMPLIGTAVSMTLLRGDPLFGFGLLCSSTSPGGSGSNVWCLLLGGDVSLSLTMTFFSLTASMFMMPLWLFILGRLFIDPRTVSVPYLNILSQLALFVVPCFIGVVIRKWRMNVGDRLGRLIKPFSLLFLAYLLSFGVYVNRYAFALWAEAPRILPPALLQPYLGFTVGFCVARFAAKQPKYRAITVAIETGVQNVTIPMIMLQGAFEQPYGDLAATMPVTTALCTPIPLICVYLGLTVYQKLIKPRCGGGDGEVDAEKHEEVCHGEDTGVIEPLNAKEAEARAEQTTHRDLDHSYLKNSDLVNQRDSLLIQNGLTGSALGRQFFLTDKESVI